MPPLPLPAAVAAVAVAFRGAAVHSDETGCGRCFGDATLRILRSPGAPLPPDDVARISGKDPTHWEDRPAVMRRILPRLVALLAEGTDDPDRLARGLAAAGWQQWPAPESRAVARFLDAWWAAALAEDTPPTPAADVLAACTIARASATPFLARWATDTSMTARAHLARSAPRWWEDFDLGHSPFDWWWGSDTARDAADAELREFLTVHAPRAGTARSGRPGGPPIVAS
ncbi:hypothetical protein [Kitasatospora paranensis]|uniref:Uncharacterized protein n=1 Tax=Kitasatospora paranensis TaxID=258053 RepID=A0ABW2FV70_9ACTN